MERIDRTATGALRAMLKAQPTTPAKVSFAWAVAAGTAIANATTTSWSEDGVLRVTARNDAWKSEVLRARPIILQRLEQWLGPDVVTQLLVSCPGVSLRRA